MSETSVFKNLKLLVLEEQQQQQHLYLQNTRVDDLQQRKTGK